ncbi:hypothetical protein KCP74_18080 [Salmonella enterica subsp. enterica]|nr:hypothetical protein KCP74_18080 [Salmonella enterica subsp. enterica]
MKIVKYTQAIDKSVVVCYEEVMRPAGRFINIGPPAAISAAALPANKVRTYAKP